MRRVAGARAHKQGGTVLENYFNYFTEIEDHFQRRRGSILLLSTLDWALIETWREAGIPLEAVLRGIDAAFDKYDARKRTGSRRINGLAWCAQAVMGAAQEMQEASLGAAKPETDRAKAGLEWERIAAHLREGAAGLRAAAGLTGIGAEAAAEIAERLTQIAGLTSETAPHPEELEKTLTALEQKLLHAAIATTSEAELAALREQSAQEIAPYRRRMQALQIRQIEQQFLHKRLLEKHNLPRLSLFYMRQD
ncbi:MAG TPA: hypothetical protein VFE06_10245 [Acidobacteriaceae bacterium]|jgi:hypothetical protein|nr:hypothetical protein [Acidobacteriaceae bacterium]